jgi:orotate phosphoribosyltransferase
VVRGQCKSGDSVVVLDDVITTQINYRGYRQEREAGLNIFCVIALVDRGGRLRSYK